MPLSSLLCSWKGLEKMIGLVAREELVVSCACSSFLFLSFSMDPRSVSSDLLSSFPCLIVLLGESSCLGGFDQSRS